MEQSLFTITCTTCQARLEVRNESLIGQIVACPKCQSMVHITPPAGWSREGQAASSEASAVGPASPARPPATKEPPAARPAASKPSPAAPAPGASTPAESSRWTRAAGIVPPPLPKHRVPAEAGSAPAPTPATASPDPSPTPASAAVPVPMAAGISPIEQLWRKGLLWVGAPVAGLAIVVALVWMLSPDRQASVPVDATTGAPSAASSTTPFTPAPKSEAAKPELPDAGVLSAAWVPDDARLVVSLAPSRLASRSGMDRLFAAAGPLWRPVIDRVLGSFGLTPDQLRRVTWSAGDLSDLAARGVVVIEVEPDCDLSRLVASGTPAPVQFRGATCRWLVRGEWREPFALLGSHTIVTGQADVLAALDSRVEPRLASRPLAKLLDTAPREGELSVLVDLAAARRAGWPLPERALNVWPPGARSWQTLCRRPEGLGIDARLDGGTMHSQLDLVCADAAAAEAVLRAVERLAPTGRAALADKAKMLSAAADKPQIEAYALLLHETVAALEATRWEQLGTTVRVWTDWAQDFSGLGLLILDTLPEAHRDWMAAGAGLVGRQESRLLGGLDDYCRAKDRYPAAAVGGALLPPETRLSWIATLLPYYGRRDWHEQLGFGFPWDASKNEPIAKRILPEVVNPLLGPATTRDGFPVTHYVGSAGLGADAPRLPANDPRAGLFGFGRTTQPSQIRDGANHTIAILGVTGDCGPWASGGRATVRGLARQPYVNGPDGFGTSQPDGMLVGMADGSVRFLSKDVDPRVVEQLVTIAGGERPIAEALPDDDSEPVEIEDEPAEAAVKPEAPEPEEKSPVAIPIEIARRLARPVANARFDEMELGDFLHLLCEMSALDIQIDQPSLTKAGVSLDAPVTIESSDTTVGQLLADALEQCGLTFAVRDGRLVVTGRDAEDAK
ncbi:MAG: hypothetical protein JW719_06950 [Pirellulales bacterium]|nr:hypothetical protein [Pirellulales bacterium]